MNADVLPPENETRRRGFPVSSAISRLVMVTAGAAGKTTVIFLESPLVDGSSVKITGGYPTVAVVKRHLKPSTNGDSSNTLIYAFHGAV